MIARCNGDIFARLYFRFLHMVAMYQFGGDRKVEDRAEAATQARGAGALRFRAAALRQPPSVLRTLRVALRAPLVLITPPARASSHVASDGGSRHGGPHCTRVLRGLPHARRPSPLEPPGGLLDAGRAGRGLQEAHVADDLG